MIDFLFEIVEPNGYCLNGYDKNKLLNEFKKNTIASKEEPTKNHLYKDDNNNIKCWSILEAHKVGYDENESFIFPIDYDKEFSIENLSPTTINWILNSERNIKIKINGKDIKDFNEFEKDFYDKVQEKEKVTIE